MTAEPAAGALPRRGAALLLLLTGALLLFRLGAIPLVGPDEPRYARVAVEMSRGGDWVTPTLQGRPWLEKPPLYYWLAAAAFRMLGETELAARLPSVLASVALVGATAALAARFYGGAAGLHAGFVLATSVLFFVYGHAASMDMLVAACVTGATTLLGARALGGAGRAAVPAAYALMGLGTLAKGPIGVLLPLLSVGAYVAMARDRRLLREMVHPWGLLAFVAVAAPWYLLVWRAQGQAFVDVFLLDHNLKRFTSTIHRHPGPPWYYVPVLLAGLFPWSGLLVPALAGLRARTDRRDLFVALWLVLPLLFFSAAGSKLPGYVIPCLPPLAALVGRGADEAVREGTRPIAWRAAALIGLALGALTLAAALALHLRGDPGGLLLAPAGLWAVLTTFAFSRTLERDRSGALRALRVGGAGLLVLTALAAPRYVAARESGRELFLPANGREVLAWGAWRTNWMAGYFYNDGRVREVSGLGEVRAAAAERPALVLCGPAERRRLEREPAVETLTLAEGPRGNALLRVRVRQG